MKRKELLNKVLELADGVLSEKAIEEIKGYSEEELEILLEALLEEFEELEEVAKEDEESEEYVDELDPEARAGLLACQEEEIRQKRLYEEKMPALSEETLNSELYNDMITMAESVVAGVRVMVKGGIDYTNALTLCSNYLQNKHNLQMATINQIQIDKNQI